MNVDVEEQEAPILEDRDPNHQQIPLDPISEPRPPRDVVRKRLGWLLDTLQDAEGHASPRDTFRWSKRPQRYSRYSTLMSCISDSEPSSFEEAVGHHVWKDAMMDEFQSIMKNDVCDIVPGPEGKSVVTSK